MKLINTIKLAAICLGLATSGSVLAQDITKALKVGDKAIDFTLENAKGEKVSLYEQLKSGPVVLTWYRGVWCPYCNVALKDLQDKLPEIKAKGATLLAISPQVPDQSLSTEEKNKLEFQVLSDIGNKVGKQYNIVFKLDEKTNTRYENGFGLSKYNGDEEGELPIPATYVIGVDKIIKYAYVNKDYTKRVDADVVIKELGEIQNSPQDLSDQLVVIWSSDDPYVAKRVALMYTHAAKRNKWFNDVTLIVWGPSAKLIAENKELQTKIKEMIADGVKVEACSACSNAYGTTEILKGLGYNPKPMGVPLTDYLKGNAKVLTF